MKRRWGGGRVLNDAILTFSGRVVRPLDPDPTDIDINDIAHSLANQCRFTGHTKDFFSVAQHAIIVSQLCDYDDALWGLLHDGTEAYLADLARPIKHQDGLGVIYRKAESRLMDAIAIRFGLEGDIPESVKWADEVALRSEMRDLMPSRINRLHSLRGDKLDYTIIPMMPHQAERAFMLRFFDLGGFRREVEAYEARRS
jgi:uncharacterized protein